MPLKGGQRATLKELHCILGAAHIHGRLGDRSIEQKAKRYHHLLVLGECLHRDADVLAKVGIASVAGRLHERLVVDQDRHASLD